MTVAELIVALRMYPEDMEVVINGSHHTLGTDPNFCFDVQDGVLIDYMSSEGYYRPIYKDKVLVL